MDLPFIAAKSLQAANTAIGGIPIGCSNEAGIYSGYTMVAGDDFNGPLNVVNLQNPFGKYFSTRSYTNGVRCSPTLLQNGYDIDPYTSGSQDSNRGIPIGTTDTLFQSNGILNLKMRTANAQEVPLINNCPVVGGMIHSGGFLTVSAPCIIESYCAFSDTGLSSTANWHPSAWVMSASYLNTVIGSGGGLEFDHPEVFQPTPEANFNPHGTTTGAGTTSYNMSSSLINSGYHLYSLVLDGTYAHYYVDGVLQTTVTVDCTQFSKPYYVLLTSHTITATAAGVAAWASQGYPGATMSVDYFRIWTPTSNATPLLIPSEHLPTLQVGYNTSMTYTFPSAATLWGSGFAGSDYCQCIKNEDFEPGSNVEGGIAYNQFPAGLSFNSGTRVLTGKTTDNKPGRLYTSCTSYLAGGYAGQTARGYIDVGPNILATDFVLVHGVAASIDLYPVCDCGTLLPKVITCTGLPTGLSFSAATGLITGTPTTNASTSITIGVSNCNGQTASKSVNLIVQASADAIALDGTASGTSPVTISTTLPRDILVLVGELANASGLGYVTDTAGLTWVLQGYVANVSGIFNLGVYYARANAALTSNVITGVNMSRYAVCAVNGINMINPFDTNFPLPLNTSGTTATSLGIAVSTNAVNNMLIAAVRSAASLGTVTEPSGFSNLVTGGANEDISYQINSSAVSGVTETYSWTGTTTHSSMIITALQGQV